MNELPKSLYLFPLLLGVICLLSTGSIWWGVLGVLVGYGVAIVFPQRFILAPPKGEGYAGAPRLEKGTTKDLPKYLQPHLAEVIFKEGIWFAKKPGFLEYLLVGKEQVHVVMKGKNVLIPQTAQPEFVWDTPDQKRFFLSVHFNFEIFAQETQYTILRQDYELFHERFPVFTEISYEELALVQSFLETHHLPCKEVTYMPV